MQGCFTAISIVCRLFHGFVGRFSGVSENKVNSLRKKWQFGNGELTKQSQTK